MASGFALILPVMLLLVVLMVGYYLVIGMKKESSESGKLSRGSLVGCLLGLLILLGIGAGLWKLGSPPFSKEGAFSLTHHTELIDGDFSPQYLSYYFHYYRGAIIVDVGSLRIVYPDRSNNNSIFGTAMIGGSLYSERNPDGGSWSTEAREILRGATIDLIWTSDGSQEVVTIAIDDVVFSIKDGVADIQGKKVPATGPLQVIFLDGLGNVDEVRSPAVGTAIESNAPAPAGEGKSVGD